MNQDRIIEQIKLAQERKRRQSAEDFMADLVRRGVINEKGQVLLRIPEPPLANGQRRKKKKRK